MIALVLACGSCRTQAELSFDVDGLLTHSCPPAAILDYGQVDATLCAWPPDPLWLEGVVEGGMMACTEQVCRDGDDCCQSCWGGAGLAGPRGVTIPVEGWSCAGRICSVACTPHARGTPMRVHGIVSTDHGQAVMRVVP